MTQPDPYPTIVPIPYDPEDPVFTEPIVATPAPQLEYLTAQEAIDRQAAIDNAT